jgi:hypothetical protein
LTANEWTGAQNDLARPPFGACGMIGDADNDRGVCIGETPLELTLGWPALK